MTAPKDPHMHALESSVLKGMTREVVAFEEAKGWQPNDNRFLESLMLLATEVSEAADAYRKHQFHNAVVIETGPDGGKIEKPVDVPSELADVLIRLLSTWDQWMAPLGLDLADHFDRKMKYNWTRSFRHGGRII